MHATLMFVGVAGCFVDFDVRIIVVVSGIGDTVALLRLCESGVVERVALLFDSV